MDLDMMPAMMFSMSGFLFVFFTEYENSRAGNNQHKLFALMIFLFCRRNIIDADFNFLSVFDIRFGANATYVESR